MRADDGRPSPLVPNHHQNKESRPNCAQQMINDYPRSRALFFLRAATRTPTATDQDADRYRNTGTDQRAFSHCRISLIVSSAGALSNRMTRTLKTYLGRDAGQRVLSGRIVRGIAERIDAVVWFSDLRGFTRITDTAPEQVIPLLNDYSDVIVSAIHEHGGDVLKLIGDGTLVIFTAKERAHACGAALSAAFASREGVAELNRRRATDGKPITDMLSRFACWGSFLWKCRQPRAARFYRHWPGGERGKPHRGDVPFGRSARGGQGCPLLG